MNDLSDKRQKGKVRRGCRVKFRDIQSAQRLLDAITKKCYVNGRILKGRELLYYKNLRHLPGFEIKLKNVQLEACGARPRSGSGDTQKL
jgi:hypothetical protein